MTGCASRGIAHGNPATPRATQQERARAPDRQTREGECGRGPPRRRLSHTSQLGGSRRDAGNERGRAEHAEQEAEPAAERYLSHSWGHEDEFSAGKTAIIRGERYSARTARFTSSAMRASTAAVSSFTANAVGHISPSSSAALSLKPSVA
jgi:hypothetical protein